MMSHQPNEPVSMLMLICPKCSCRKSKPILEREFKKFLKRSKKKRVINTFCLKCRSNQDFRLQGDI